MKDYLKKYKSKYAFLRSIYIFLKYIFFLLPIYFFFIIINIFVTVRFGVLLANHVGHFSGNNELYLLKKRYLNNSKKKYFDVWFYTGFYTNVCNEALEKIIKRKLFVMPYITRHTLKINNYLKYFETIKTSERDTNELLQHPLQLTLSKEEIEKGEKYLKKIGIHNNQKIVCLIVRDDAYAKKYKLRDESYKEFYNNNIDNYIKAAEFLANKGYFVVRMGKITNKKISLNSENFIDYSHSNLKDPLMDIYFMYKCYFCITGHGRS